METAFADEGDTTCSLHRSLLQPLVIISVILVPAFYSCRSNTPAAPRANPLPADTNTHQVKQKPASDSLTQNSGPRKKIYLTFDDAPNKGTPNVFRTVKEENVPASFFVVGKHVFDTPEQNKMFQELQADSSIELCNHSYTHAQLHYTYYYAHPAVVIKDFEKNESKLHLTSHIARMPGRNAWRVGTVNHTDIKESKAAIDSVQKDGYAILGWDVEWMFDHKTLALTTDTDLLIRQIENMLEADKTRTPGHLVLLAHDQAFQSDAAVQQLHYLFQQLKNNPAFELVLASSYPGVKKQ